MANNTTSSAMELRDYLAVLRRRRSQIIVVGAIVMLIALIVAIILPPTYRSTSTVLIERQEVPPDLVQTTVTGYVQERLKAITDRIMTRDKLLKIAQQIGMYNPKDPKADPGRLIAAMRKGILVQTQDVQVISPTNGSKASATVSFTVSFDAPNPTEAQKGAAALTQLYMEEDRRDRLGQARAVSDFLGGQAEMLRKQLSDLEKKLARFKEQNVAQLPDNTDMNMRLLEDTSDRLQQAEDRIRTLRERKMDLQSQLAMTSPYTPVINSNGQPMAGPVQQLAALRAEYAEKSATYSPDYPDLVRLRQQIAALQRETGNVSSTAQIYNDLSNERSKLATLRERYSENYPDVVKLKKSIAALERQLAEGPVGTAGRPHSNQPPSNPAYIRLQTDLNAVMADLDSQQERIKQLQQKHDRVENRLVKTPTVERDYLRISRDYDNALKKYREVKDKQMEAQSAEQLEEQHKAQRFSLISPPGLPGSPESPNRKGILLLGFVFAMGCGVGTASAAEYFDRTVRGIRGVNLVFGAPPLATIPYVENGSDVAHRHLSRVGLALLGALIVGALAAGYRLYEESGVAADPGPAKMVKGDDNG